MAQELGTGWNSTRPANTFDPNRPPPRNGFAIAALVFGVVGFVIVGVGALMAIGCSLIALRQIRSAPPQRGDGMAVTALVLGGLQLALHVVVAAIIGVIAALNASGAFATAPCPRELDEVERAARNSVATGNHPTSTEELVDDGFLEDHGLVGLYSVAGDQVTRDACPAD